MVPVGHPLSVMLSPRFNNGCQPASEDARLRPCRTSKRSTPRCGEVISVIRVSLQGQLKSTPRWLELARAVDAGGFDTLYVADHPGTLPAPFVTLAAAATVTDRIRLGTCVVNAGRWEPLALAAEVATLDVLSGGRSVLGIGAGHTPAEWSMAELEIPGPAARIAVSKRSLRQCSPYS